MRPGERNVGARKRWLAAARQLDADEGKMPANLVEPGRLRSRDLGRQFRLSFCAVDVALSEQRKRKFGANPSLELAIGARDSIKMCFANWTRRPMQLTRAKAQSRGSAIVCVAK